LPALRGRLDAVRQFTLLVASPQRLACRFDELSQNCALNQIMKATILRLLAISTNAENQRKLTELAWMQGQNCFGQAPLLRVEFGVRETLPLATLPIPTWILRRKRIATLEQGGIGQS